MFNTKLYINEQANSVSSIALADMACLFMYMYLICY